MPIIALHFSQENTKKRVIGNANVNKAGRESIIRKSDTNNNNNTLLNSKKSIFLSSINRYDTHMFSKVTFL